MHKNNNEITLSNFISNMLSEAFEAVVSSLDTQEEKLNELIRHANMNLADFKNLYVNSDILRNEILEKFPSNLSAKNISSIDKGQLYRKQSSNISEYPPLLNTIGYNVKDEDIEELKNSKYVFTSKGYKNISDFYLNILALNIQSRMKNIINTGISKVLIENGRILSKVILNYKKPCHKINKHSGKKIPNSENGNILIETVNLKGPEFYTLKTNIISEIEINFKTLNI